MKKNKKAIDYLYRLLVLMHNRIICRRKESYSTRVKKSERESKKLFSAMPSSCIV